MKFIKLLLVLFISINSPIKADSNHNLINELKKGGNLIFIRHAYAPGGGDPNDFNINDCKTQRNLNKKGIDQSKMIGKLFEKNKIKIDQVLTSQWCRCIDTAKYAFKNSSAS